MIFGININELLIYIKSIFMLYIVWFTSNFILILSHLSFLNNELKLFLVYGKDFINLIVSLLILILTIIKIVKERKNLKK